MGSGKSGGGSGVYNYFGTIAGALALVPVDEIYAIEVDDEIKWEGLVSRFNSPNPVPLDVPGYGRLRFHWGTDDQLTTDPVLTATKNTLGHQHPAYTGVCYAVLVDFLFGQGKTTAPNIRIYVRRAATPIPKRCSPPTITPPETARLSQAHRNYFQISPDITHPTQTPRRV